MLFTSSIKLISLSDENKVLDYKKKRIVVFCMSTIQIFGGSKGAIIQYKTLYFPDKHICYNVDVPVRTCRHDDLIVSNIRNNDSALFLI